MDTDLIDDDKKAQILSDITVLSKEQTQLLEEFEKLTNAYLKSQNGLINVRGRIYPGVKINIGNATMTTKDVADFVSYKRESGDIKEILGKS